MSGLMPTERIEKRIFLLHGQRVMLSTDLAELYGVAPKVLVQALKRNIERFLDDFVFQLRVQEVGAAHVALLPTHAKCESPIITKL
jgi:ORF6N domain-containing protein